MSREKLRRYLQFFNPIAHLGERRYSFIFPFLVMVPVTIVLELYAHYIVNDPNAVGSFAIALYILLIIYFAFRFGIRGGMAAVLFTVSYYFYIIYSRGHTGQQLTTSLNTTLVLGGLYFLLAGTIGWLRQTIDSLIVREVNVKKRLLTVIRQLPVGIVITDAEGMVLETNEQLRTIVGRRIRPGFRIGQDVHFIRNIRTNKPITQAESPTLQAMKLGKVVKNKEFLAEKKDGSRRNVLVSASPIYDREGVCTGGISVVQDITSMREMEKRKDDFVNIASHELKTPITSLILYLEILKRVLAKKEIAAAAKTVSKIESQVGNLQELIATLLDVSRIQVGKILIKKERVRLDQLVEEVVQAHQDVNGRQKIIIKKKREVTVNIDKNRISQVIANLIANAIKYSSGKGEIEITIGKSRDKKAIVSVKDRGIGITPQQQKRIFEKLYQVKEDKAGTFPGFGMGLYIAREIVQRHHGKIWVESEIGRGSTFYFSLPLE